MSSKFSSSETPIHRPLIQPQTYLSSSSSTSTSSNEAIAETIHSFEQCEDLDISEEIETIEVSEDVDIFVRIRIDTK